MRRHRAAIYGVTNIVAYLRCHWRIKLLPGLYLNLSKTSLSLSFGIPGLRYCFGPRGERRTTVGLPGTGLPLIEQKRRRS